MSQQIEGLPVGTKLVGIRSLRKDDHYISPNDGKVYKSDRDSCSVYPIICADNAYAEIDLAAIPVPDGYERDGETPEEWFRIAKLDDKFVAANNCHRIVSGWVNSADTRRIVVRPVAKGETAGFTTVRCGVLIRVNSPVIAPTTAVGTITARNMLAQAILVGDFKFEKEKD